ncbi:hypothetical protein J41TS12_13160 [Paenibacillus antibioticophila]|uniref:LppX_LprAFG lipoprotein n=1 Tax=Paenibacillus antibioticophila TaxID=1274374 RepID=A0A919XU46_9BACL|nr:DUF6612 family protein [Paenibacillus antibioticophila]GIO36455.1 hypothetical protein J41TS12_13160 [Paenibacillus antibioticophila]
MNKRYFEGLILWMVLVLTACGAGESTTDHEEAGPSESRTLLTAGEVIRQVADTFEEAASYSVKGETQQELERTLNGEVSIMKSEMITEAQWIKQPLQYHLLGEIKTEGMQPMTIEEYFIPGTGRFSSIGENGWVKLAGEELDGEITDMQMYSQNLEELLDMLERLQGDVLFTQEGNYYVMTLELPEEELLRIDEMTNAGLEALEPSHMSIQLLKRMKVSLKADKDSLLLNQLLVDLEIDIGGGEDVMIQRKADRSTFFNFNGIDAIELTPEVIETAR